MSKNKLSFILKKAETTRKNLKSKMKKYGIVSISTSYWVNNESYWANHQISSPTSGQKNRFKPQQQLPDASSLPNSNLWLPFIAGIKLPTLAIGSCARLYACVRVWVCAGGPNVSIRGDTFCLSKGSSFGWWRQLPGRLVCLTVSGDEMESRQNRDREEEGEEGEEENWERQRGAGLLTVSYNYLNQGSPRWCSQFLVPRVFMRPVLLVKPRSRDSTTDDWGPTAIAGTTLPLCGHVSRLPFCRWTCGGGGSLRGPRIGGGEEEDTLREEQEWSVTYRWETYRSHRGATPTSNLCCLTFLQPGEQCERFLLHFCFLDQIHLCISLTLLLGHRLKLFWLPCLFYYYYYYYSFLLPF